ncbi:hypothetical protein J6590_102844 [Homalodisca vitripennis]|nr:hypothetical protein J6590_102844 [Homalodisca vitripennis]
MEVLIELVCEHPVLWDSSLADYRNNLLKDKACDEVARSMNEEKIMPRTHTRLPGTRGYGDRTRYTTTTLYTILEHIKSGKIGEREAAKLYNIPRQTLINKLNNKHGLNVERPMIFSTDEEISFVQHCIVEKWVFL